MKVRNIETMASPGLYSEAQLVQALTIAQALDSERLVLCIAPANAG